MTVIRQIASECRADRTYALTIAGIGFWLVLAASVLALDSIGLLTAP
jgi:hypothetical protein